MTGVALIGAGMVAGTYVRALAELPQLRLAGVLTRSPDSARAFLDRHGLAARAYRTLAEVAADPAVDFAILVTPPDARQDAVAALARAGKPILMEKPVERTLAAATSLVEACEAARVPLGIVLQHRARPAAQALASMIAAGGLGRLRMMQVAVPWWRPQGYYDAPGRGTYARDGGGVLLTQAIHTLDLALHLSGRVTAVTAMTATTGLHRMESEDFAVAGLELAGGIPASLVATTAAYPGRGEEIALHHDRASARLAGGTLTVSWQDGREETGATEAGTGSGADPMAFPADNHRAIIADFAAAIGSGRPPLVPGREALRVHALIDAIERSAREGRRIVLG